MLTFYLKYVIVHVIGNTVRHFCWVLFKINIDIKVSNNIHGGIVLSVNNYSYVKSKGCIKKIDDKHFFFIGLFVKKIHIILIRRRMNNSEEMYVLLITN